MVWYIPAELSSHGTQYKGHAKSHGFKPHPGNLLLRVSLNTALLFVVHLRPLVPLQADIPTSHLSVEGVYMGDHTHHCMYPELLVSSLVLEPLQDNETLLIKVSAGELCREGWGGGGHVLIFYIVID